MGLPYCLFKHVEADWLPVWCLQGHFQIVLNNEHCPLFQKDMSWFQRLMYCSGVWAYIVGAITTPMFIIIPLVSCSPSPSQFAAPMFNDIPVVSCCTVFAPAHVLSHEPVPVPA